MSAYRLATLPFAAIVARAKIPTPQRIDRDLTLIITRTDRLAEGVIGVRLESAEGSPLPGWHPGAHLDLLLPSGKQRQYSLCGDPADHRGYRIAVRRIADGGGASIEIHELTPGTALTARGPRNGFPLAYPHLARADISRVAFIAGGIGITAILPMVTAAAATGVDWTLTYLGRDKNSMPFLDEITALDQHRVRIHTGPRLTPDDLLTDVDARTSVYFCGPPAMLHNVRAAVDRRPTAGFHFERFAPPPIVGGREFQLRLDRTQQTVTVTPDESALAAVRKALPEIAYSCRQGFCGTCRVRVLSGQVERHGHSSFGEAPDSMLICVDRAADNCLTLDL